MSNHQRPCCSLIKQFLDEYFQHGFRGGQYVANLFAQQIKHILPRLSPLWQPGQPIRIKYYMDIYATAQDLVDREVLVNVANLVAFLDGLSSQHLIDCIQVGSEESLASKVMSKCSRFDYMITTEQIQTLHEDTFQIKHARLFS